MIRSGQRKMFCSAKVSEAFRPTDPTGTGVVVPSYPRAVQDAYTAAVVADSPLFYLRLDDTDLSTTAVDKSGNGRNFTTHGTITARVATGFTNLNYGCTLGSNGYLDIAHAAWQDVEASGDFTLEAWAMRSSSYSSGIRGSLLGRGFQSGTSADHILRFYQGDGIGVEHLYQGGVGFTFSGYSSGTVYNGSWHHLVYTRSGSNLTLYLDGSSIATATLSNAPQDVAISFVIGAAHQYSDSSISHFLNGSIAGVAFYGTALSSARVTAHYNAR
jgi:hypothetical protein